MKQVSSACKSENVTILDGNFLSLFSFPFHFHPDLSGYLFCLLYAQGIPLWKMIFMNDFDILN